VDRWSAYLTDDEPTEIAFFCPECAEREFAPDSLAKRSVGTKGPVSRPLSCLC